VAAAPREKVRPMSRLRLVDLMTRATPMVPRAEQRRWLALRSKLGALRSSGDGGLVDLGRLRPEDRGAFATLIGELEASDARHPVVAEIVRRTQSAAL
jgi:hypothetical protein